MVITTGMIPNARANPPANLLLFATAYSRRAVKTACIVNFDTWVYHSFQDDMPAATSAGIRPKNIVIINKTKRLVQLVTINQVNFAAVGSNEHSHRIW